MDNDSSDGSNKNTKNTSNSNTNSNPPENSNSTECIEEIIDLDLENSDTEVNNDNKTVDNENNNQTDNSNKDETVQEDKTVLKTEPIANQETNKIDEPMDIDLTLDEEDETPTETAKKDADISNESVKPPEENDPNIIDLDDSDSDSVIAIKESSRKADCINPGCLGFSDDLKLATGFCLSFYRVKYNPKQRRLVCKECRDVCLTNYEKMANLLVNNESLFNHKLPIQTDCVEINDSDEEEDEVTLDLPADELDELKKELDFCITDVIKRYDVDFQISSNLKILNKEFVKIADDSEQLDQIFNDLQTKIDVVRNSIYAYKAPAQEIQGIDIDVNGCVSYPSKVAERRSSRKILKPVTYNEIESNDPDANRNVTEENNKTSSMEPPYPSTPPKASFVPKFGTISKESPKLNEIYFAMKSAAFGAWTKCRVLEIFSNGVTINGKQVDTTTYRVNFIGAITRKNSKGMVKLVTGKQLAYSTPSDVRLSIGHRVIALFKEAENANYQDFYAGIVAEPLCATNNFRYLIFFDDGYAQYVKHENVFLIVDVNKNVWEDIPFESRSYIQQYLNEYPERPMVKLSPGQIVRTERNGKWWPAKVLEVDGSLVLMYFENERRKEWIYRGSRRLAPLFTSNYQAMIRQKQGFVTPQRRFPARHQNQPYVEYTRTTEHDEQDDQSQQQMIPRAVARKSTTSPNVATKSTVSVNIGNSIVPFLPTNRSQSTSRVIYYTTRTGKLPGLFKPHQCNPNCKEKALRSLAELRDYSVLAKPILAGWFRETVRYGKNKRDVRYVTPCLRVVRNMQELHRYLRITHSEMSVDMFDFNSCIHVLTLYSIERPVVEKKDLSDGQEFTPIHVVNDIDDSFPEYMRYTAEREPTEGVHLNLDKEFLCGCDCVDDCQDKIKCSCWQLTIQGTKVGKKTTPDMSTGYVYKRLLEPVVTGIYECNSRCKCNANTCLNRVVQHPSQLKLQVFKTPNRGWGIRCLHDIPRGSFICIYAGQLLTEQKANEGGINFGDEYLAELDYIEVVERLKEGYESDVPEEDMDGALEEDRKDDDDEDYDPTKERNVDRDYYIPFSKSSSVSSESTYRTRSRRRNQDETSESKQNSGDKRDDDQKTETTNSTNQSEDEKTKKDSSENSGEDELVTISDDEESVVRQPSSFIPSAPAEADPDEWTPKYKSVRKMFGPEESCYIMDAKNAGNIGRFLNHSCSPNVFVQNVFVDTHDLRFPWVAFFASTHIRAGTELTWNYNYDVGSVPGKIMYCHCGSEECRGRLL